jgi:hypothetical protein
MQLVEQWNAVEQALDPRWSDAHVELVIEGATQRRRALALLAPAAPGSIGTTIRFHVTRSGAGVGPEAVRRMLRRLHDEGIRGTIQLVSSDEAAPVPTPAHPSLAADWDAAIGVLPADWSDLLCELELKSSDYVERAALLVAPINPVQTGSARPGFRFRSAHTFGYGASAGMVRRCLARLDEDGIPGEVRIVRALSDTHPVATQGPVWYVGGKAV